MMTDRPTATVDPAAQTAAARAATAVSSQIPSWFDDDSRPGGREARLAGLARPGAALLGIAVAGICWWAGRSDLATALLGVVALAAGFVVGIAALREVLSGSHGIIGVARAVVEEAVGTRLSVLLVMLVVVGLPVLPLVLDPAERLAYRLQFFLDWSLSGASVLLALISIALCCSSVCGDIESRRIHMALSKPLRRWEYLLGKWLGVVLLDLLLVILVGIGVYAFAQALRRSPANDSADRRAVEEQVLTARGVARPIHPAREAFDKSVEAAIEQIRRDDPATFDKDPAGARRRIVAQHVFEWHVVSADVVASYLFTGLDSRRMESQVVQLRLQPFADNSKTSEAEVRFALWLNERPYPVKNGKHEDYVLSTSTVHTIELPTKAIAEDGTLRVTIANRNMVMPGESQPTSIGFNPGEGLEILYRVGSFEGNFVRGQTIMWAKLAMLSAAALAAASWLGFPIAVLVSLMVFVTAVASGFLADAIDIYTGMDRANPTWSSMVRLRAGLLLERLGKLELWEAAKTVGSYFADAFLTLIPSFGDYDAITQVATGRVVSAAEVMGGLLELGVFYPVLLIGLGWLLLEKRDLVSTAS
jgi:hypothetical protein